MKTLFKKAVAALIALTLLLGTGFTASAVSQSEALGYSNYFVLRQIIELYLETSLYETDRDTLIDNMLYNYLLSNPLAIGALANALLSSNDPYSAYYSAQDPLLQTTSNSYGIIVADSDGFEEGDARKERPGVYITEVLEGSNAEFAGLLEGDRFISLDGINVEGMTVSGVKYLLNGMPYTKKNKEDSPLFRELSSPDYDAERFMDFSLLSWDFEKEVKMEVERIGEDGVPFTVEIFAAKGNTVTKDVTLYTDKETSTATISVTGFNTLAAVDQFTGALDEVYANGLKNIIIDLRDNPGGHADAAVRMASVFINEGTPLYYTRTRTEEEPLLTSAPGGQKYDPAVFDEFLILVNENTASAAELLAYILRSQVGAKLIGTSTFGKALGQTAYQTVTGDSFTITSLEILTLDKTSYNGIGLEPDIYVPDVTEKYIFPTGLSHFNHENYVTIVPGATNDAVLALEQRFGILGIIRPEKIDGIFDDATAACTMIYKNVTMRDKAPTGEVTFDMVTKMTATINGYKNMNVLVNTQMNVANLYIKNNSQGKRLAKEYVTALEKQMKALEEERAAAQKEYEEELKKQQEEAEKEAQSEEASEVFPEEAMPDTETAAPDTSAENAASDTSGSDENPASDGGGNEPSDSKQGE